MKRFDLINCPLQGRHLIEASAGTGKTYTISGLVIRLLIEAGLSIDKILVVTFTEAATEDLRRRIREKLTEAVDAFRGNTCEDSFISDLVEKSGAKDEALIRLTEALQNFDEAAVYTIHGFCQRLLIENSLEAKVFFDAELEPDHRYLLEEVVRDFFRKTFYTTSPLFAEYAAKQFAVNRSLSLVERFYRRQDLLVLPDESELPDNSSHKEEDEYIRAFDEAQAMWSQAGGEVKDILLNDPGLNRNKYRESTVVKLFTALDTIFSGTRVTTDIVKEFERITTRYLIENIKKDFEAPQHRFFDLCESLDEKKKALLEKFDKRILILKKEMLGFAKQETSARAKARNVFSFDDLLDLVHGALAGPYGDGLAAMVRGKYPAALIDEFQDTDPLQYDIFNTIYQEGSGPFFMIGDPKQAIYSFRGADVFTYLEAAKKTNNKHTLDTNWRSAPPLVEAVNTLFLNHHAPFMFDTIQPVKVSPSIKSEQMHLLIDGKTEPSFQVWFARRNPEDTTGKDNAIKVESAKERILPALAGEISRLLDLGRQGRARVGEEDLSGKHIAVLVRKNKEARMVQRTLGEIGISSIVHSSESVFRSVEAEELERILVAVASPGNEKYIKAALCTDFLGVRAEDLDFASEERWHLWLARFRSYRDLWSKQGFMRMFKRFLNENKVGERVLSYPDGERRYTNLLHLAELLHEAAYERRLHITGTLKYLADKLDSENVNQDEYQMRLESERNCVQVVTIHKAKGLEYPVVFCPFSWSGVIAGKKNAPWVYHSRQGESRLVLDLSPGPVGRQKEYCIEEELAEDIRLLYVALTRAAYRCYFVWGAFNNSNLSAPAYLFHQPEDTSGEKGFLATAQRFLRLSDEEIGSDLAKLVEKSKGAIAVSDLADIPSEVSFTELFQHDEKLFAREFCGRVSQARKTVSFSSLSLAKRLEDFPDHDEFGKIEWGEGIERQPDAITNEERGLDIFSFPHGAKPGNFMHDLLEHLDFTETDMSVWEETVAGKLSAYGFEKKWNQVILQMVDNVLNVSLASDRAMRLSLIGMKKKLCEMEFYFPIELESAPKLADTFRRFPGKAWTEEFPDILSTLGFVEIKGFMKGFVDLIFEHSGKYYLVDWKSNFLGSSIKEYQESNLRKAMQDELYTLQYHIYTVAVHRYLSYRLTGYSYEKDFGGVFYIFLRGVDKKLGPQYGVFHDNPSPELISALSEIMGR